MCRGEWAVGSGQWAVESCRMGGSVGQLCCLRVRLSADRFTHRFPVRLMGEPAGTADQP